MCGMKLLIQTEMAAHRWPFSQLVKQWFVTCLVPSYNIEQYFQFENQRKIFSDDWIEMQQYSLEKVYFILLDVKSHQWLNAK